MKSHNDLFLTRNIVKSKHSIVLTILLICYFVNYIRLWWRNVKYTPITLYSTTQYTQFVEQLFILNKINYLKIFKPYHTHQTYLTTKGKEIFINPLCSHFSNELVDFKMLEKEKVESMEDHFGISLNHIQEKVLELLPKINAYQIGRGNFIENEDYHSKMNKIKSVTKLGSFYCLETNLGYEYTSLILTDYTFPLKVGEILNFAFCDDESIHIDNKYILNDHYHLISLCKKKDKKLDVLPFYSLDQPRANTILHPFHFPKSNDFILSILIVTQYLINY